MNHLKKYCLFYEKLFIDINLFYLYNITKKINNNLYSILFLGLNIKCNYINFQASSLFI